MPRPRKTGTHAQRGPNGAFTSTQTPSEGAVYLSDDDSPDDDPLGWESASDDGSDESEPEEYWAQLPKPMTWEERMEKRAIQKEEAEKKRRITEMRGAEHRLAGPVPKQKGKQNGPYSIGGMSVRTASGKRKTLKDDYESGRLAISEVEFKRQMGYLQARKPDPGKQLTLGDMFRKRPRAVSVSADEVEISSGPVSTKRLKGGSASSSAAAVELREEEEESSSSSESETGEEQHPELLEQEAHSLEHGTDDCTAHGSLAKNALTVTKINVNPGGKVPEMRETVIPLDNPHGHGGKPQKMVFDNPLPDNHPHKKFEGQPKGMKLILAERGYTTDTNGKPLIGDCKACKASKARKPHLDGASPDEEAAMYGEDGNDSDEEEDRPVDCCMRRLLSHQSDFVSRFNRSNTT
ncbi:hypothetical protein B0H11DRAFT_2272204 [Mycena galericulata]|nr:hypothetical protein B0H11DRAFT_2272204 [Mycena galericulata]